MTPQDAAAWVVSKLRVGSFQNFALALSELCIGSFRFVYGLAMFAWIISKLSMGT